MVEVTSEEVAAYRDGVAFLAWRYVGIAGAEFDDLEQEGLIDVWLTLAKGLHPSYDNIGNRMKDYVRWLRRLQRREGIPYEERLPLEYALEETEDESWDLDV